LILYTKYFININEQSLLVEHVMNYMYEQQSIPHFCSLVVHVVQFYHSPSYICVVPARTAFWRCIIS